MRSLIFTGLVLLVVAPAFGQTSTTPGTPPLVVAPVVEKSVSIDVKNARFGDAMLALAKQGHFSFVSDAYLLDFPLPRVQINAVPVSLAVRKLAELYDRNISRINGIFILSRTKRVLAVEQDKVQQSQYKQTWDTAGEISILPVTKIQSGARLLEVKQSDILPPFVSVEANTVAASRFMEKLSSASDWLIFLKQDLADRRVSAYFERTTPGQAAEAISTLFHARQRVIIEQSDAQVKQDAALFAEITDQRTPLEKSSNVLQPQVMKLLTRDQLDRYNRGEQVEIPVSILPAGLQKSAMDYIALSIADLEKTPEFPHPDATKGFSLMLMSSNAVIAVIAHAADGTRLGF